MLPRLTTLAGSILVLIWSSIAFALSPSMLPEEVVRSQLAALQEDDIYTVFKYASPSNKAATGPWQRFASMVRAPPYRYLVRHEKARILLTVSSPGDSDWKCLVRVWPRGRSPPVEYWWFLSRCSTTEYDGLVKDCYMVDGALPNWILPMSLD